MMPGQLREIDARQFWFGSVPETWPVLRNKNAFVLTNKKVGSSWNDETLLSLTKAGVIIRDVLSGKGKFPASFEDYQIVRKSNVVFCLFDIDETPRTVGLSEHDGMITGAYNVFKCKDNIDPRFITYFYIAIDERKGLKPFYTGLRKVVRFGTFMNAPIPIPDLELQKNIADFLDSETARIDQFIEKKNEYLSLSLKRQKNTVSHAISSGLAAVQQKKETGYYWLPKIPAHWHMYPLKALIWFQEGPGILAKDFYDDGIPLLRIKGLGGKYATLKSCNYLNPVDVQTKWRHFRLDKGDLLISGSATTSGIVAEVGSDTEGSIAYTGIIRIKTKPNGLCRELIPYFLMSRQFDEQIISLSTGSTIQHFGPSHLSRMKAPLAPLTEQRQIASYLDKTLETQRQVSNSVRKSITLLQEYRTTLITAAVTGQIDVKSYGKSGAVDRHLDQFQDEGRA